MMMVDVSGPAILQMLESVHSNGRVSQCLVSEPGR